MQENVRIVRRDELGKLLELYKYLNPEDPDIPAKAAEALWESIINDPQQHIFVIEEDGVLAASCTLVIVNNLTRGGSPYALIENVVTHGNFRRRGFGTAVLKKAIKTACERGCYKVMLLTGRKDQGTLSFYEKAGFERGTKTGFCIKF
jgi:GNAT superfamily N-acetyltransferase